MFKSRRKKAMKLLADQYIKIDSITMLNFDSWKSTTDVILKQYIDEKFIIESRILGHTFELDYEQAEKSSPEEAVEDWLMMKKSLAKDYITRHLIYLGNGGQLISRQNWFCQRTVGELLTMIAIFQAILLGSVLPFTCNQGKVQGAADSKKQIEKLEQVRDSLRTELINCISNLPKPNDSPKDKTTKDKD